LGVVAVAFLLALAMGWQAWSAFRHAQQGNAAVLQFRARLLDRDVPGAQRALGRAQSDTASARSSLTGVQWSLLRPLPVVGDDVDAAQRLVVTVDDVTQGALPAVVTALSDIDPRTVGLKNGRVQLAPLRRASGQLDLAANQLTTADRRAAAIETRGLTSALAMKVTQSQELLHSTASLARRISVAGRLLPDMLGQRGTRNYLVLAQNSAEQRSLGGIPGAFVLIRAQDGRLSLVKQATAGDLGTFDPTVLPLSSAEKALYGVTLGTYPADVTDTPDFPRAAQLIKAMWERREGGRVDGVASLDPYALQLLIGATGPVQTQAGTLTGTNAARRLLVDVYKDVPDPQRQNEVFAQAARQVFDRVRIFGGDPRALTTALTEGVDQGRVMVWSARPAEQSVLASTALGRTLRASAQSQPAVGVYLHDRTQSKMSTYQRVGVQVTPARCGTTSQATVSVRIRSAAPRDRDLPLSVTGDGTRVRKGNMLTQLVVYAPDGWTIRGVEASDGRRDLTTFQHEGLWAGTRDFELAPGQEKTLTVRMGGSVLASNLGIRYTPGVFPANVLLTGSRCS